MYAIMVEVDGFKDILSESMCERSDDNLKRIQRSCEEWKAEFPECNYYVVKIDYEVVK